MQSNKDNKSYDRNGSQATPTVSVIMNCLNGEKYLRQAIDSVFKQTFEDWEIIFWEDKASTDNSGAIAKSYGDKLRYFKADVSLPLYGARNPALKLAKGEYIAFLDCDDRWLPNKLQLQLQAFEKNKNLGLIHTNAEILELSGAKRMLHKKVQPSGNIFREMMKNYRINLQTVMISKEVLNSLDYWFDASMLYSGDADLFLRIAKERNTLYLPRITAQYREHGTSLSATRIETLIRENEKIIDNLSRTYDGFLHDYSSEIAKFRIKSQLSVIIAKWKYINGKEARKVIAKNMTSSSLFILLYILSFFPYKTINFFRKHLPI